MSTRSDEHLPQPIDITDELDLLRAYHRTSPSIQRKAVIFGLYELLHQLMLDLALGFYQPEPYRCFAVEEPTLREIFAPSFRDRLVHHLVVERLMPLIDRRLIFDSYANRPGKGVHAAVLRLQRFMRRCPPSAFFMQCDIAAYFTSIDRCILKRLIVWHLGRIPEVDAWERDFLIDTI